MSLRRPPIESLTVDDLRFAVRWSARRRSIGITVKRDGDLVVAAPVRTSARRLEEVVRAKLPWVRRKLAEFEALGPPPEPRRYVAGELFPYLGREYPLVLADSPPSPVALRGGALEVDRTLDGDARVAILAWYEDRAVEYIDAAVARYVPLVGRRPGRRGRARPRQAALGGLRPPHTHGELPLAPDHTAPGARGLRGRPRTGAPPRAQPWSGVLAPGGGRAARLQAAAPATLTTRRPARLLNCSVAPQPNAPARRQNRRARGDTRRRAASPRRRRSSRTRSGPGRRRSSRRG